MIQLFLIFLKIGFLGFGGGYAMLSLIYENATKIGITPLQFSDLNALDLLAPGPIAVNSATYVGYITQGLSGAVLATIAVCISSFLFSHLLYKYETFLLTHPIFKKFLNLTKISAVGIIASVAVSLIYDSFKLEGEPILISISIFVLICCRFKQKMGVLPSMAVIATVGILYGVFLVPVL